MVADLFRSRTAFEVDIWILRQQINVLRRTAPKKQTFSAIDRLIFVCLHRLLPGVRVALAIVKPETVVKWHRAGVRLYWRWKSRARGGRPTVPWRSNARAVAERLKASGRVIIADKHEIDKATWRKPRGVRLTPTSRYIGIKLFPKFN